VSEEDVKCLTKYHATEDVSSLTKYHGMKTYGKVYVQHRAFLTSALDGGQWS